MKENVVSFTAFPIITSFIVSFQCVFLEEGRKVGNFCVWNCLQKTHKTLGELIISSPRKPPKNGLVGRC